ncbi:MAG: DUF3794 domain-containing protein [Oscillospiraceae bacterium]|nr:DUF3794 domain-containing protein [Oscillospiraceae bacterium]
MEFKTASGLIRTGEVLCDCGADVLLEGEYTVPDYQPEIFRVLHTEVKPVLLQKAAVGQYANVEGYAEVTVRYQAPENGALCTAAFKLPFSRRFELSGAADTFTDICCNMRVQYLGCNALGPRRLQARGTLNVQLLVISYCERETVQSISGEGVQQLAMQLPFCYKAAQQEHRFSVDETLEMDFEGCEAPLLLYSEAYLQLQQPKYDGGRVSVSGNVLLSAAVSLQQNGEERIVRCGYELPFHQLLAMELPQEDALVFCSGSCSAVNVLPDARQNVLDVIVSCALEISAYCSGEQQLLEDVFSTKCETAVQSVTLPFLQTLQPFEQEFSLQCQMPCEHGAQSLDWGFGVPRYEAADGEGAQVSAEFFCVFRQADGSIAARQQSVSLPVLLADSDTQPLQLSFAMRQCEMVKQGDQLRLYAAGGVQGLAAKRGVVQAVSSIAADEEHPKMPAAVPLVVHYVREGETVWQLAKRFNTSAELIAAENARLGNDAAQSGLLLIPMV